MKKAFKPPLVHALERTVQDGLTCFASWGVTDLGKTGCLSNLGAWLLGLLLFKSYNLPGKNLRNCLAFYSVCTTYEELQHQEFSSLQKVMYVPRKNT